MNGVKIKKSDMGITSYLTIISFLEKDVFFIGERKIDVFPNDLIIARENLNFQSDISNNLIVYSIEKGFFDNLFDSQISDCKIFHDFLHADNTDGEYLFFSNIGEDALSVLNLLRNEYHRNDIYHEKLIRLLLVGLFSYLDRNHYQTLIVPKSTMGQNHEFGKIMKYIGENYKDITLESVAKKFGYNPDYFSYRFKKITGVSFSNKLMSIKMEESMHLLVTTDLNIQQIAEMNGYHDRSHFSRNFKTYTGLTPKEYRNKHKKSL
jgi:AraC-like DNA-binding protein